MTKLRFAILFAFAFAAVLTGCKFSATNSAAGSPSATPAASHAASGEKPKASDATASPSPEAAKSSTPKPAAAEESADKAEMRCGWFSNPTPGNAWLDDNAGEWLIGAQGGYQADGDWPDFPDDKWVKTNGNYGYGCACMKVTVDKRERRVIRILSATAKPLADCRRDKALVEPSE